MIQDPARLWAREAPVARHLPFLRQIDDNTLETRDGLLMQTIALRGLLFETADSDELDYRKGLRDAMLRAIGSSEFALYHHVLRRRVLPDDTPPDFPDRFSQGLDNAWRARLEARQLFVNELYLTLVIRPRQGRVGLAERIAGLVAGRSRDDAAARQARLRDLDSAREALMAQLASYAPRLLGTIEQDDGALHSEPLALMSRLLNGEDRPVVLPRGPLDDYLPTRRVSFGAQTIELGAVDDAGPQYVGMLSVKDYAGQTSAGMFDELFRLPFELAVTHSFAFVDRSASLSRMNLALRRMRASDDEALSLRAELAEAKDEVAAGRAAFGEHHMTIAVHGGSEANVDAGVAEVRASLADLGINAVREELALEPAFWAQFPGNFRYIARRGLVSTANFASFASFHNFALGRPHGNHWGEAVSLMETTAAGPYFFNFHHGDLGNFTVIGPSGSGKTVVLNFLLAQARKLKPRIVFFDKDRGAEIFIRAIGGRYAVLRPGEPSGLNPLALPDTPVNRALLADWLAQLAGGVDGEEAAAIRDALDASFAHPPAFRRLSSLVALLRGGARPHGADLYARLQPWWGAGEHAWLFDNAEDRVDLSVDAVGFDMTQLLDTPALRTPAMMILFHRVEQALDGHPAIIVVDEGWKALDDDVFVARIRDWEKTIRKRNGIVGFATQSAGDALGSRIASAIIEQAATQIFMVNAKARAVDYIDGFGLSQHEYDLIRTMPDSAHCFLVKQGGASAVVRLNLSGEQPLLTVLSGRESTVRRLNALRAQVGDDPEAWLPLLQGEAA